MRRLIGLVCLLSGLGLAAPAAQAIPTGATGGGQPVDQMQPFLAMRHLIRIDDTSFEDLAEVVPFAGNFAPAGYVFAEGQLMSIAQNTALFSKIGFFYGGDGMTTFALPDLRGRVPIHRTGPGVTGVGEALGSETTTLTQAQIPAHDHSLPGGGSTSVTGGGQPFGNHQPSLPMSYALPLQGSSPFPSIGIAETPFHGQVRLFPAALLDSHAAADGQLLSIAQNPDLWNILGTTFGGDGITSFALPDLRGRAVVGEGAGPGLTPRSLGEPLGSEDVMLSLLQLPAHTHTLPPSADVTGATGGGQPYDNIQPSLVLHYIIAIDGVFPSRDGDASDFTFLGKVALYAGTTAPDGWAFADGQILSISQNTALFALLGVTYGGDGRTTFALPDLRGRVLIGAGDGPDLSDRFEGEQGGAESVSLGVGQLPPHVHDHVPAPVGVPLAALALAAAALRRRCYPVRDARLRPGADS